MKLGVIVDIASESIRGLPLSDHQLLVRGTRYTAIPIVTTDGILDVYLHCGTMNGNYFIQFFA